MKTFGQILKESRIRLGYKQLTVAKELGVLPYVLSLWENDKRIPRGLAFTRLLDILNLDSSQVEFLINGKCPHCGGML